MVELIIYDNTVKPKEIIQEVIGDKGFGDVIVKRRKLEVFYEENIKEMLPQAQYGILNNNYDIEKLVEELESKDKLEDTKILHCLSSFIISDKEAVALTFKKLAYIEESIQIINNNQNIAIMFHNGNAYIKFLRKLLITNIEDIINQEEYAKLTIQGMVYIGEINNFIQCITGNFDSRYFNSLQGSEYKIKKSSKNKNKIKSEYTYYHLLPEKLQSWFVMPFDYQENRDIASYTMERLYMTDIAIKWVHGSIYKEEFSDLMDMYFYFFSERSQKVVSKEIYMSINDNLYHLKVAERIESLKHLPEYKKIDRLIKNSSIGSIDEIFQWYLIVKKKVEDRVKYSFVSVIGHGDPCFANALYNRATRTLKFIDPKGALNEEELWTNPYYDLAKLSHSVCGLYDFFNNAMFDITINEELEFILSIPFDNTEYKRILKEKVIKNGFDYWSVRIYEASLFLSMLPLHMDYPLKVFAFILNAIKILKEIEENV